MISAVLHASLMLLCHQYVLKKNVCFILVTSDAETMVASCAAVMNLNNGKEDDI